MKLASMIDGTRDGRLVVVSRDLQQAVDAKPVVETMREAIESWDQYEPGLQALYERLINGAAKDSFPFDPRQVMAPLPRAFQWADASSFLNHGRLMEKAYDLDSDKDRSIPIMYQGSGDTFYGAHQDYPLPSEDDNLDFEGEVAVILDDVPMGVHAEHAESHIKLLMLLNDVSLRAQLFDELKLGFGLIQSKPSTVFAPVAITPDELGEHWADGRVHLPIRVEYNDTWFGEPVGSEMDFSFGQLIAHLAQTRRVGAGTVLGSGTFSNRNYKETGSACLSEKRAVEIIEQGAAQTPFLQFGDRLRFEMLDQQGQTVFGAIEHKFVSASEAK